MQTILVVEDDDELRDTVGLLLEREGFRTLLAAQGPAGLDQALAVKPDLVIVDLRLPGLPGTEICKRLKEAKSESAIIVLSAIGDEVDKVLLLEMGADDYVVKPFSARELLARIRAVLRRAAPERHPVAHFSDVTVDFGRRIVQRRGSEVKLTPAEYRLLVYFLQQPDRPLTRDEILNTVWGYDCFPTTRTVDTHVVRLRQKLEDNPSEPRHFLTVHGVGYRFAAKPRAARVALVVDDMETSATAIALALDRIPDLRIEKAHSGKQALQRLSAEPVSVMVTDLGMPGMDGLELIAAVRAQPSGAQLPIILVSGEAQGRDIDRAASMGVRFVEKPFSPIALRRWVEELLDAP